MVLPKRLSTRQPDHLCRTFGFAGALDVLLHNEVFETLATVFVAFYAYRIYELGNP